MLISCKCLNILLNVDTSDDKSQLNQLLLSKELQPEQPFQQQHQQCPANTSKLTGDHLQFFKIAKESDKIWLSTIQHTDLINVTLIDNWNVYSCIHCKTVTHAEANDSTKFLMNPSLLKNQEKVNMIKSSKNFSKAFNILLQERNIRECERNVAADDETNGRAKKLRQYLADVIEHEKDATEERIERYTKQQTALLKAFCEKVKQEFSGILCAVDDVPDGRKHFADGTNYDETIIVTETGANNSKLLLSSHLTPPVTPDSTPMSIGNSPNFRQQTSFFTAGGARISTLAKNVEHSTPEKRLVNPTRDGDVFFEIDGLDTASDGCNDSQDDSDSNDDENGDIDELDTTRNNRSGISITSASRQYTRVPKLCAAQSLPMAVPIFNQRNDKDYDEYPEDNVDIAASIKALAKSVHGEAIFGDLPRPRFSTQI